MLAQAEHIGSGDTSHRAAAIDDVNDPAAWCSFCWTTEPVFCAGGEIIVLRVVGEVDMCALSILQAALGVGLDRHPAHLLVDLTRVTFCSAQGLALLIQTGRTASETATSFAVCGVPPQIYRVWTLVGDDDLPICYLTTDAAVTVIQGRRLRLSAAVSATCGTDELRAAADPPGSVAGRRGSVHTAGTGRLQLRQ